MSKARTLLALASVPILAGACADPVPTAPRAPVGAALTALGDAASAATGGGFVDLSSASAGVMQFAFGAVVSPHGQAQGRFHQVREVGGLLVDFEGEVTCLAVDAANGRAWIAGVVTKNNSTHPAFLTGIHEVGDDAWFRVVDYGEGGGAAQPDRSTVLGFEGAAGIITSAEYCATLPWPDADARTFPVSRGNLQIRP